MDSDGSECSQHKGSNETCIALYTTQRHWLGRGITTSQSNRCLLTDYQFKVWWTWWNKIVQFNLAKWEGSWYRIVGLNMRSIPKLFCAARTVWFRSGRPNSSSRVSQPSKVSWNGFSPVWVAECCSHVCRTKDNVPGMTREDWHGVRLGVRGRTDKVKCERNILTPFGF